MDCPGCVHTDCMARQHVYAHISHASRPIASGEGLGSLGCRFRYYAEGANIMRSLVSGPLTFAGGRQNHPRPKHFSAPAGTLAKTGGLTVCARGNTRRRIWLFASRWRRGHGSGLMSVRLGLEVGSSTTGLFYRGSVVAAHSSPRHLSGRK
ncbi:hypothetical protein LZ31DRAFT_272082 [Colletotrichum somersetense]|nr:hypothetical protein LZ31DRAFT_272082 [Colletotrichum somersetense]